MTPLALPKPQIWWSNVMWFHDSFFYSTFTVLRVQQGKLLLVAQSFNYCHNSSGSWCKLPLMAGKALAASVSCLMPGRQLKLLRFDPAVSQNKTWLAEFSPQYGTDMVAFVSGRTHRPSFNKSLVSYNKRSPFRTSGARYYWKKEKAFF